MLQYEPGDRITWKDIFENELFQEKQRNGVKDSMQIAEQISKNKLEMSTKMNQIYFQDKKIIEQIEMASTQNESVMEDESSTMSVQSK